MITKAWTTLLSSKDYLEAVLVLNRSLKQVKSKFPLVVACTPNVYENNTLCSILEKENIIIERIKWYEYTPATQKKLAIFNLKSVYNVGAKIHIFGLRQYDKLIYIDADALIVKNIDNLFKKKDGSSLYDIVDGQKVCFCAMFVFEPKNHLVELYTTLMTHLHINDGTLMELTWWQIKSNNKYAIPRKYFYTPHDNKMHFWVKAYHLQLPNIKYWKIPLRSTDKLAQRYYKYLDQIRKDYLQELYLISLEI